MNKSPRSSLSRHALTKAAALMLLSSAATTASAADGTWIPDGSGNWSASTSWNGGIVADGSGSTATFTNDITADRTVTLDAPHTLTNLVFGDANTATAGSWLLTGAQTLTLAGTTPTITVNALGAGKTVTISSVIAGTSGLTKAGVGTLVLNGGAVNTFTGGLTVKQGTLSLDFANLATPTDLIKSGNTLTLGGGTLSILGKSTGTTSQTFNGLTLNSGASAISLNSNGGTATNLVLGGITRNAGATINFTLPTAGNISTTNADGFLGTWASVGSGTSTKYANISSGNIVAYAGTAATTAADLTDTTGLVNYDLATATGTVPATVSANTIRYTGAAATTTLGATSFSVNGLMNAGSGLWTIASNTLTIGANKDLVVNTASNDIAISSIIANNAGGASALTKTGAGTLTLSGNNSFTGMTTLGAGTLKLDNVNSLKVANAVTFAGDNTTLWINASGMSLGALTVNSGVTGANISFAQNSGTWSQTIAGATLGSALTINQSNNTGINWNQISWSSKITGGTAAGTDALIFNNTAGPQNYFTTNAGVVHDFTGNVHSKGFIAVQNGSAGTNQTIPDAAMLWIESGEWRWNTGGVVETIDGLRGAGLMGNPGNVTLTINANNAANEGNRLFSGTLALTTALTLGGTGTQEFSGATITSSGATNLNNGTLRLTKTTGWNSNITFGASNSPKLQLNAPLLADSWTFSKQLNGTNTNATIEKIGAGTMLLSPAASSTFNGTILVSAGKLYVNSAGFTGAPSVSVSNGTTFGGTGTVGNVTVANGGTLEGGYTGAGTLTAGNLILGASSSDAVTLLGTLSTTAGYKAIAVTNLTINGGNQSVVLNAAGVGLTSGAYYDLLVSTNAITAPNVANVVDALKSNSRAYTPTVDVTGKKIQLYYDANASIYWTGAASNAWNTAATNWKLTGNSADTKFMANDVVFFNDGAASSVVDISGGDVTPIATTFNNSATNYTLQGTNGISTGSISKSGNGTLTINNTNTTTGAVALNGGVVNMTQGGGLGSGAVTFGGGELDYTGASNATWSASGVTLNANANLGVTNAAATFSYAGAIGGAGGLTKTGAGTLTLSGTNGYTGATIVDNGVLNVTGTLAGTSAITVNTGGTMNFSLLNGANIANNALINGGTLALNYGSNGLTYSGNITGTSGILNLTGSGSGGGSGLTLTGNNTFSGDIQVNGSRIFLNSATGNALSGANIIFKTGFWPYHDLTLLRDEQIADNSVLNFQTTNATLYEVRLNGHTETVGGLQCTSTLAIVENAGYDGGNDTGIAAGKIIVNVADGASYTYNGSLRNQNGGSNGALSFEKKGLGTQTLTRDISYTGSTTVTEGTLILAGSTGFVSAVSLNGGTLAFENGSLGTGTVTMNGGVLRWETGNTQDVSAKLTFVNAKSATFDTNGNTVTLASAIGNSTTAALVKTGAGTLTLTGDNTHSGGTTITLGTLNAANNTAGQFALGTGNVTVQGGTLAINAASVGQVTLGAGATLAMTSGSIAIDITGASTFDKVVGDATAHFILTGGTLFLNGFAGFEGTGGVGNTYAGLISGFSTTGNSTIGLGISGYDTNNWLASLDAATGNLVFTAVPEPSTYGLIGAGALAAAAMVRRRRRRAV